MTNKPNNKIEEKRYYACRVCGFSPTNRSTWCDKGCGSDYNEMIELKGLKEALTSHGEEMKKEGYEQGVRDERECNELKQDIIAGRKVTLYGKDCRGGEVEGYEVGKEYEVDEVRVRPGYGVQVFLKGNIHSYPVEAFIALKNN